MTEANGTHEVYEMLKKRFAGVIGDHSDDVDISFKSYKNITGRMAYIFVAGGCNVIIDDIGIRATFTAGDAYSEHHRTASIQEKKVRNRESSYNIDG